jgi:hypothetical protein
MSGKSIVNSKTANRVRGFDLSGTPDNGDVLIFNSATGNYEPEALVLGATKLNDLTDVNTGLPVTPTVADDGRMLHYDFATNTFITDDSVNHGTVVINAKKGSAGTIAKGLPVYITGFDSDLHQVELANASAAGTMPVIGFTAETLDNTNTKHVITFGKLQGIDTTSTVSTLNPNGETWAVNDSLYISTTAGGLTNVRPTGTALIQRIAKVLNVDASGGQILIFNTARTAGLPNLPQNNFWIGDANAEPQANTASQARTVLNVADGANNYVHPNHTGEVTSTGDGATVVDSTAISNKTVLGSLAGTEEFLINDGGTLKKVLASNVGGADGNGIYDGSGLLSGATTVTMGGNNLSLNGGNTLFGTTTDPTTLGYRIVAQSDNGRGIYLKNTTSTGNASSVYENNRGSFASYSVFGQTGSAVTGTYFGQPSADLSLWFTDGASTSGMGLGTLGNKPLTIGTNNASRLRILGNGNVGINFNNPTEKLHVGGNARVDGDLLVNTSTALNANAQVSVLTSTFTTIWAESTGAGGYGAVVCRNNDTVGSGRLYLEKNGTTINGYMGGTGYLYNESDDMVFGTNTGTSMLFHFGTWLPTDNSTVSAVMDIHGMAIGNNDTAPTARMDLSGELGYAPLRIRSGVAPTSPNDGDFWYNGTNLNFRNGGSTVDLLASGNGIFDASNNGATIPITTATLNGELTISGANTGLNAIYLKNTSASGYSRLATVNDNNETFEINAFGTSDNSAGPFLQGKGVLQSQSLDGIVFNHAKIGDHGNYFFTGTKANGTSPTTAEVCFNIQNDNTYIGLGTTVASERLHVGGNTLTDGIADFAAVHGEKLNFYRGSQLYGIGTDTVFPQGLIYTGYSSHSFKVNGSITTGTEIVRFDDNVVVAQFKYDGGTTATERAIVRVASGSVQTHLRSHQSTYTGSDNAIVAGAAALTFSAAPNGLFIGDNSALSGSQDIYFGRNNGAGLLFEYGRFLTNGNFGINENNPSERLHVGGNAQVDGEFTVKGTGDSLQVDTTGRVAINTLTNYAFGGGDSHLTVRSSSSTAGRPIFAALNGVSAPAFTVGAGGYIGINKDAISSVQLDISCSTNVPLRITDHIQGAAIESYADDTKGGVIWQFGFSDTTTGNRPARGYFGIKGSDANGAALEVRDGVDPTGAALIQGALWRVGNKLKWHDGTGTVSLYQETGVSAMTNVTAPVNLDANTVTVAELADIVGNLIDKLRNHGLIAD